MEDNPEYIRMHWCDSRLQLEIDNILKIFLLLVVSDFLCHYVIEDITDMVVCISPAAFKSHLSGRFFYFLQGNADVIVNTNQLAWRWKWIKYISNKFTTHICLRQISLVMDSFYFQVIFSFSAWLINKYIWNWYLHTDTHTRTHSYTHTHTHTHTHIYIYIYIYVHALFSSKEQNDNKND